MDAYEAVARIQPAFGDNPTVNVRRIATALWQSCEKQRQAARHVERLKLIDTLRRHLYEEMKSDTREFHLAEMRNEAVLTAEAAIFTLFSSLDILSHALAEVFALDLSDREATFFNVVTIRNSGDAPADGTARKSLARDLADYPVTRFLVEQRRRWIQELSEWRHFVVHHGCLTAGEYVGGGVLLFKPSDDTFGQNMAPPRTATDLIGAWTESLRETLETAQRLLCGHLDTLAASRPPEEEQDEDPIAPPNNASGREVIQSLLDLWCRSDEEEPRRIEYMFSRLSSEWRREWRMDRFRAFIEDRRLVSYELVSGISSGTHPDYGWHESVQARFFFEAGEERWYLTAVPTNKGKRFRLVRTPATTPPSRQKRIAVETFTSRQSGRDTGHRDLVFSVTLRNVSNKTLTDVEARIFWMWSSEAKAGLGASAPGESRTFECSWKDACLPIGDFPTLYTERGRFRIRIAYNAPSAVGCWWAEDCGFDGLHYAGNNDTKN